MGTSASHSCPDPCGKYTKLYITKKFYTPDKLLKYVRRIVPCIHFSEKYNKYYYHSSHSGERYIHLHKDTDNKYYAKIEL